MKVGYRQSPPISKALSLIDVELPDPRPGDHDLLVEIRAISVNPLDTKVRLSHVPPVCETKVLGWDASGIVLKTGPKAKGKIVLEGF